MGVSRIFSSEALAGEVALVTGASRGIGAAIAEAMAEAGAVVVGTATSEAGASAVNQKLQGAATAGRGVVLDVVDAKRCEAVIDEVTRAYGKLSILVNNAGITRDGLALRMKDDDWQAVIETNLSSVFRLCRGVLRGMMKARHGRIVNITSVVGEMGNAGQANYAAAKAAVSGLSRALAREVGSRGITVNCIAPGFIDTDMTRALGAAQTRPMLAQIPLGRLGSTGDVASAAVYLASAAGGYVTGATLHVNGGMFMA